MRIKYNAFSIMKGAFYSQLCSASSIEDLSEFIRPIFEEAPFDLEGIIRKLKSLVRSYSSERTNSIVKRAVSRDLKRALNFLDIQKDVDLPEMALEKAWGKIKHTLGNWGMGIDVNYFIVNSLPPPYKNIDCWAMNCDRIDEKDFGIPKGIYFIHKHLMPWVSPQVLAHEVIHSIISHKSSTLLARGIEEGICDLASILLCEGIVPNNILKYILINQRNSYPEEKRWIQPQEALRQASLFALQKGSKGLIDIIKLAYNSGRKVVKDIERRLREGKLTNCCGVVPNDSVTAFAKIYLSIQTSLVVSPLAFEVAHFAFAGLTTHEISNKARIPVKEVRKALQELQDDIYVLLVHQNKVWSSDAPALIRDGVIRYQLGGSE